MFASPPQAPVPSATHYRPANASAPLSPQPLAWDILQLYMQPFLHILLISEDSSSSVGTWGEEILDWGLFCSVPFVLQVEVCPSSTISHIPAPAALTAASPPNQPSPCATGLQLITFNSPVIQQQNTITSILNKFRSKNYTKVLFGLSSHLGLWNMSEASNY